MTDIINEEENLNQTPEEIEEIAVVDNGTTYESTESAIIAKEEAAKAKLWAQESERQANLASGSADTAAQARDDAIAAKEYAEAAVTDANVVAVGTDLRSTPSNIKTVASNITDVTTVAGVSSAVTTVAGVSAGVTTVAGISSAVTTVASNATNVSTVAGVSSDVTTVAGISSDVTSVAGNATDISAVAANNTNITAVAGNATNINAVNANKTNIDKVAGDINRVNLVADDIASVHTVAVDISTVIDVANNKTNIDAVAGNNANITAVAGNSTNINAVNANKTNIDAVAANNTNITAVAGDLTNIRAVAADLTNIDNASANAQLAKDWATKMDGMVASEDYSAKYYADQARQAASGAVTDGKSITRNSDDELQTIGVINQNDTTTAIKTWTGTKAQYEAIVTKNASTEYFCTDTGELYLGTVKIGDADLNNKANIDLSNLTSAGKNITNWSSNVTNCITKIPQDIKLELNSGTLTLKVGSKLYVPNGFEQDGTTPHYDIVTIDSDKTLSSMGSATGQCFLFWNKIGNSWGYAQFSACTVGTTPPSNGTFWNTTTNTIKYYEGGVDLGRLYSIPFSVVTRTSGIPSSLDKTLNGFSYFSNKVIALPGVEGLAPNGRNADGTYNTIKVFVNSVLTKDITGTGYKEFSLASSINWGTGGFFVGEDGYLYARVDNSKKLNTVIFGSCDIITAGTFDKISFKKAFSMSDSSYVVDNYSHGTSWYRVYSDGWCEQGGYIPEQTRNDNYPVTLLKPYIDTNYSLITNKQIVTAVTGYIAAYSFWTKNKTASGFTTAIDPNVACYWQASGYIS